MEEESFGADQADIASESALNSEQCSSFFSSPAELRRHKEERPYKCNQCEKSYRHAGSLVNHKKTHQIGLYTCLICQKEFSNPMGLKSHLRTHSEDKRFKCEQCGEAFRMSQQLYNHRRSSHCFSSVSSVEILARNHTVDVQAPILVDSSNLISNLENYIAESMVPGDFSQLVSKYYQDGNSPAEEPANDDVTQQGPPSETREEQAPSDNTEEYRYKCNQCEKAYKHAGSLANHRQSHMVGLYQCAICFKEFSNLMAMKNHCRLHSDSRARQRCKSPRYSAKIGGPLLANADMLRSDLLHPSDTMDEHEDLPVVLQASESSNYEDETEKLPSPVQRLQDDLHPDSLCSEQTLQRSSKDSMIQVEENTVDHNPAFTSEEGTGQQSEEQQCDENFEEEGRPEDSENRPFRCQECGKTYRHAGSLINHKKTHQTGVYSCPLCSKQMFNVAALNNHFRAHFKSRSGRKVEDNYFHSSNFSDLFQNPEDSFLCRICGECLPNESDYLQHQVTHQEEAIRETFCDTQNDTQNIEEALESGTYWPENPQVSQTNNDTSGPSVPNPVKLEVEDLAQPETLHQWTHEETLTTPLEETPQNNGAKIHDPSSDFEVFKDESSPIEEHDKLPVDRPYKCEPCGRTYRHKSSLINHKLTHKTGIYQCSLCPKQYSNLMALRNHLRFHSRSYAGRKGILSRRGRQYLRGRPRFLQNKTVHALSESIKLNENMSPQTDANDIAVERTLTQFSCSCGESFDCSANFQCHSQMCQNSMQVSCSVEPPMDLKKMETLATDLQNAHKTTENPESQVKVLEASEHQGRRVYECDLCNKSYRHSGSLINHKRTHQTGDYMCPYCSRHVHNMAALKNHIRIHHKVKKSQPGDMPDSSRFLYPDLCYPHPGAKDLFGCVSCEEIFHSEDDLIAHQMVHMAIEGEPWEQKVQESDTAQDDKNLSVDNISDSDWERSNNSDIHKAENHGSGELVSDDYSDHIDYTCIECGEVYTSIEDLNNHKLTHQIGIYQCSFCPKEYPNLPALRDHFQSHTKPHALRNVAKDNSDGTESNEIVQDQLTFDSCYDCGHCGLIFSNEVDFHQHQVAHETQVKKTLPALDPEGKEPEFSFPMDSSERELLRRIKSELEEADNTEAPDSGSQLSHICGYCGQTYDDLESLQAHSLSHDGGEEKPLANESLNCDADNQDDDLQQTPVVKEEENSDKTAKNEESQENRPYTCDQCGKSYRHGGSLVNHKKTHLVGNFQCVACSKQYPNMAAYINHLRHHPECKQQVAVNSQHEPNASDFLDSPYTTGEGGHLNFSPSGPIPDPSSDVLPRDFKPCIDTLSMENSCLDNLSTQVNSQPPANHAKLSRKRCSRRGEKRNDLETSPPLEGGSTSVSCGSDVDDKSFQTLEFSGKTVFGVKALSLRIVGNCEKNCKIELARHLEETKNEVDEIPYLASSSDNRNELDGDYCGQTYDGPESLQAHTLSESPKEKALTNESLNCDADNQDEERQQTPTVKEEDNSDETDKNEESQENRPYTCAQCGKSYRYGGSLVNHKKTHLVGNFQCVACSKTYPNMASYINHLRHHPSCKQQVAVNRQHKPNASDLRDSPFPTGEGEHLNFSPSAPLPDPSASDVLPIDFIPCIDTLSLDNTCLDHSSAQMKIQSPENHAKLSRKQCSRRVEKRNDPVTSPPLEGGGTSVTCGSVVEVKSFPTREFFGKTFFGVKALSLRSADNCEKISELELVRHSGENIKSEEDEVPSLASSSHNRNEVEGVFHQRPFRCEVCGRSYRHAGSLINHKQTHKTGVFRCSICQKRFFNLMAMKNHNRIHFELKRHKCLDCGKAFRLRKQLDTHQRLHWQRAAIRKSGRRNRLSTRCRKFAQTQQRKAQTLCKDITLDQADCPGKKISDSSMKRKLDPDSRPYQCEECGRSYRHAGSLFNHKKSHKMGQYSCPICHKTYSNLMAMKNHERNHYEAKRHHCLQCGKTFKWKRQLTRHQFVHAQEEPQSGYQLPIGERKARTVDDHQAERSTGFCKRSRKSSSSISKNSKKKRSYFGNNTLFTKELVCTSCGILFPSSDELRNHACNESRIKLANSGNNERGKPTLSREDAERPYGCEICGRTYRHAGSLLNHKNTHKKGLYKCSLCNKQFFNPMAIKNHLRIHTAKKTFQCMECGKAFQSSRELVCHIRVHTGVGPFHCPVCNREFSSKLNLKRHQRTHKKSKFLRSSSPVVPSAEETIMCEEDTSDHRKVEPTQVSPLTQERKYKCNQCDRSYRHASSLFNHKKTHRTGVYKCPDCLKEFFNLLAYKNHLRIHKYPCKDCGKAFRIAGHLESHRKVHEQDGTFTCSFCDKCFLSQSSFEHHQLTHNSQANDVLEPQPVSSLMVEVT